MTAEQKAEEIANKRCNEIMCFGNCNFSSPKHHRCGEWHREYNCALDGYHEGFKDCAKSRLNVTTISDCPIKDDWHYVKDGDLPKEYQKCYFIYSNSYGEDNKVIFSKYNINVLTGIYAFFLDEETGEETTDPCFYDDINDDEIGLEEVYAWKEIILPKEIE
jgi:hypothetical protein